MTDPLDDSRNPNHGRIGGLRPASTTPTPMADANALADRLENFAEDLTRVAMNHRDTRRIKLLESAAAALRSPSQPAVTMGADDAWQILVNKDDRTSPEEYPDMALITQEELADFMGRAALPPANTAGDVRDKARDLVNAFNDSGAADGFYTAMTELENALSTPTPAPAVPALPNEDFEKVFIDACDEIGCAYDNEALLETIAALKRLAAPAVTGDVREALDLLHQTRLSSIHAKTECARLRNVISDTIESLERNSTSAPVVECLKAALQPPATDGGSHG